MKHQSILDNDCFLLVIDIQEAFRGAIPDFGILVENAGKAVKGFQILGLPVVITEQYPKGLGHSAKEVMEFAEKCQVIEKSAFSAYKEPKFVGVLKEIGVKKAVVCGLETHICVNQTVHDLLSAGFQVFLLSDCVSSRKSNDKETGLTKMRASGAVLETLEMALFEILEDSKHPKFKEIQQLIK